MQPKSPQKVRTEKRTSQNLPMAGISSALANKTSSSKKLVTKLPGKTTSILAHDATPSTRPPRVVGDRIIRSTNGNQKNRDGEAWTYEPHLRDPDPFNTNIAAHLHEQHLQASQHEQHIEHRRRDRYKVREDDRKIKSEAKNQRQDQVKSKMQEISRMGLNSVAYNPLTNEYISSEAGDVQRQADAAERARLEAKGRIQYNRENTFNPLTGQDARYKLSTDEQARSAHHPGV